ncbi:MAG: hypothetical protein N2446_02555 [Elusimicrobiales bacterium]|nr:hypothetical protein [Elusimicrobiales bacterium]
MIKHNNPEYIPATTSSITIDIPLCFISSSFFIGNGLIVSNILKSKNKVIALYVFLSINEKPV